MFLRLLKPWRYRKVGTIMNGVPDGVGNVLIRRGIGELVKPEQEPPQLQPRSVKRVGRA